jgi:hypothetical protein
MRGSGFGETVELDGISKTFSLADPDECAPTSFGLSAM